MHRAVVTGMGIISCLGNDKPAVVNSLLEVKSGITFNPNYAEIGMRSHVSGSINIDAEGLIDRKS